MIFKAPKMDEKVMGGSGEAEPGTPQHTGVQGGRQNLQRDPKGIASKAEGAIRKANVRGLLRIQCHIVWNSMRVSSNC